MKTCGKFLTESDNPEQPVGGALPTDLFRSILFLDLTAAMRRMTPPAYPTYVGEGYVQNAYPTYFGE